MKRISVTDAARQLDTTAQCVRVGLQTGVLPIGKAVKMSSRYTYLVYQELIDAFIGGKHG